MKLINSKQFNRFFLLLTFTVLSNLIVVGQAPSHDPSTMIKNNDGRYWIFTTGNGIWCMSSSNTDFTDWRAETAPFNNGYPDWIKDYVDGFNGFFWAPDVIKIDDTYYLYYSCAGNGAPAAIGFATASDLKGPWTDHGMVVASNNAIDPALLMDDDNRLWMAWGNWQTGIDIIELNTSTGKSIGTKTHLVDGNVEGPGLFKHDGYYYLFYQRGLCCNGLSSTYYMVVARSTSITGPYTNERTFLPNRSGNEHGPGHFGFGEGKLTYHYYAVDDNGAAKLAITTLSWVDGWPVADSKPDDLADAALIANGNYRITAVHSNLAIEIINNSPVQGANVQQGTLAEENGQLWHISNENDKWCKLSPIDNTAQAMDVFNISYDDGANINLWDYWGGDGQLWKFVNKSESNFQIVSKLSGKCLHVIDASLNDGANVVQMTCDNEADNQLFTISFPEDVNTDIQNTTLANVSVYPNPVNNQLHLNLSTVNGAMVLVKVYDQTGRTVLVKSLQASSESVLEVSNLNPGKYYVQIQTKNQLVTKTLLKN